MAEAMIEAGVTAGLPRDVSRTLVVGTLLGASRMLDETGQDPAELRAAVTSPGHHGGRPADARVQSRAVRLHRGRGRRHRAVPAARSLIRATERTGERPVVLRSGRTTDDPYLPTVSNGPAPGRRIPEATVIRLPVYQRILDELVRAGTTTVASDQLAEMARVNASKVRKDLSFLGSFGTRGSGYDTAFLVGRSTGSWASTATGRWPSSGWEPRPGPGQLPGLHLAGLPGGRAVRRRAGAHRRADRGPDIRHLDDLGVAAADARRPSASSPRRHRPPRRWPTG